MDVLYSSEHGNLTVSRLAAVGRSFEGKPEMKPPISFIDGWIKLDDKKDKEIIDILDSHPGNVRNGGKSFKKMKSDIMALRALEQGKTFASMPDDGLIDSDIVALEYLNKLPASLPPNTMKKAVPMAVAIHTRFGLVGVPIPTADITQKRLRARIVEIVETIKEQGIWNDDTDGQEDTGSGQTED